MVRSRALDPGPIGPGVAQGRVVRWRTLPDFLSTTLGIGQAAGDAAGWACQARGEERTVTFPAAGEVGETGEAIPLAPAATVHAEFATPAERRADFPAVRLVRARCRLRPGERRCAATCPPGSVVIGGGHEEMSSNGVLDGSAPAGEAAWVVEVRASAEGDPVRVAVWAMCI